jgi:hypothetical protein
MLPLGQRHLDVSVGEVALRLGHEQLARHAPQTREDALIEHVPCTDLLLDHLFAGVCRLHDFPPDSTYC